MLHTPRRFRLPRYPRRSDYGISLATPHRALGLLQTGRDLQVVGYAEAVWDAHHDVVACTRRAEPFAAEACPPVFRSEASATHGPTRVKH